MTHSPDTVTSASFIFDSFHTTTEWMPLLEALYLAIKLLGLCPSIPCGNTTRNSCIRLAFYLLRRTSVLFVIITVTKTCTSFIYSTGEYLSVGWSWQPGLTYMSFIYSAEEYLSVGWGWQPGLTWVLFTLLKNIYRLVGIDNQDLHEFYLFCWRISIGWLGLTTRTYMSFIYSAEEYLSGCHLVGVDNQDLHEFYLLCWRVSIGWLGLTTRTYMSFIYSAEEYLSVGWDWQPGLTWVLFILLKNIYRLVGVDNQNLHEFYLFCWRMSIGWLGLTTRTYMSFIYSTVDLSVLFVIDCSITETYMSFIYYSETFLSVLCLLSSTWLRLV
jgi:hypothetical protein